MNKYLIHKAHITPGAKFDYEQCLDLGILPKIQIRNEVEEYLYIKRKNIGNYFRLKFFDESTDEMLVLFIRKGGGFASMTVWRIEGICLQSDYDEDLEYCGQNKVWYESSVDVTE